MGVRFRVSLVALQSYGGGFRTQLAAAEPIGKLLTGRYRTSSDFLERIVSTWSLLESSTLVWFYL